jgi:hypothetical protein
MKRHARASKYEPFVEEVDIIEVNPSYAQVKTSSGKELTVSLRDLAPLPPELAIPSEQPQLVTSPSATSDITPDVSPARLHMGVNLDAPQTPSVDISNTGDQSVLRSEPPSVSEPSFEQRYPVRDRKQTQHYQAGCIYWV